MPAWLSNLIPIVILLGVIALVLARLPKVELGHAPAFTKRRFWNWFPLGLTYAFLYFGRYNVNALTTALGKKTDIKAFAIIFAAGTLVYGFSFIINGPLTDKLGGRRTILLSAAGAAIANLLMGAVVWGESLGWVPPGGLVLWLAVLYSADMYFQSFGAVSIVKVNAAWFHVRERGVQGGVFGILISLGVYFGYDWSKAISKGFPAAPWLIAVIPGLVLVGAFIAAFFLVRDKPSDTGHPDFEAGDSTANDKPIDVKEFPRSMVGVSIGLAITLAGFGAWLTRLLVPDQWLWQLIAALVIVAPAYLFGRWAVKTLVVQIFIRMLNNPVILLIVFIEFCTGFLRNGVMSWYPKFSEAVSWTDDFVSKNWGLLLCVFGIVGGMMAGVISDRIFHSRRGPVASVLYAGITVGAIAMYFSLSSVWVGWVLVFMALNYVGVHGMLSGTASADFGGKKHTGVAVGIIDGFVYLGTGLQSLIVGMLLPTGADAAIAANWINWPRAMVPMALIGLALCVPLWNAKPQASAAAH
ncbi:MAG: MFS transporter [Archangium sp.]|nr:MFS transporter [Archangium sp.]